MLTSILLDDGRIVDPVPVRRRRRQSRPALFLPRFSRPRTRHTPECPARDRRYRHKPGCPAHRREVLMMAAGDVVLNASGEFVLSTVGEVALDCTCCGCCTACTPAGPCAYTISLSGVTLGEGTCRNCGYAGTCVGCAGMYTGAGLGTYCVKTDWVNPATPGCSWHAGFTSSGDPAVTLSGWAKLPTGFYTAGPCVIPCASCGGERCICAAVPGGNGSTSLRILLTRSPTVWTLVVQTVVGTGFTSLFSGTAPASANDCDSPPTITSSNTFRTCETVLGSGGSAIIVPGC
jgi:hypothetical protein